MLELALANCHSITSQVFVMKLIASLMALRGAIHSIQVSFNRLHMIAVHMKSHLNT